MPGADGKIFSNHQNPRTIATMYLVNGTPSQARPHIPINDFGFCRGITVFELFRVYGGKPFRMEAHLQRLQTGAGLLGLSLPCSLVDLAAGIESLIAAHHYAHSAVKIYLTAGEPAKTSGLSLAATSGFKPQLIVMEDEVKPQHRLAPYGLEAYERGQRLKTVRHIRELPAVKTANYGIAFYAARQNADADDILFTTPEGLVTEATRSNFFAVIDGVLKTPRTQMLQGITRGVVVELARKLKIPVEEGDIRVEDLLRATEAFTTGSIAELVPACSLNGTPMASTMEGPVFSRLRKAFSELVEKECPSTPFPAA